VDGPFVSIELAFLKPTLHNKIRNEEPLPDGTMITLGASSLDWTVSPTFEVGYRLPESNGFLALSYRFLDSEGSRTVDLAGITVDQRSRAVINNWDFDYGTTPYSPMPRYDITGRIGLRLSDVYFDTSIHNASFTQTASSYFVGAGPHGRLDFERHIAVLPGFSLFGRIDGAVDIGQVQQRFRQETFDPVLGSSAQGVSRRSTQAVPILTLQAGVSYVPPGMENFRITTGYQFENWWSLGSVSETPEGVISASRGEVGSQGWFLRGQIDF
jgi:hypothetical protein